MVVVVLDDKESEVLVTDLSTADSRVELAETGRVNAVSSRATVNNIKVLLIFIVTSI